MPLEQGIEPSTGSSILNASMTSLMIEVSLPAHPVRLASFRRRSDASSALIPLPVRASAATQDGATRRVQEHQVDHRPRRYQALLKTFNGGSDQAREQAEEAHARGWPVLPIVFSVQHVADTLEEAQEIVREFRQKSETDRIVVYKRGDLETELLREEAVIPDWVHG